MCGLMLTDVSRVSELNILSLAFLSVGSGNYSIAILHLDHNENLHLLARDLILSECELSSEPSFLLPQTLLSSSTVTSNDAPPCLATVPPQQSQDTDESLPGGVLVFGRRKIRFFELSSEEWQEKHRGKKLRRFGSRSNNSEQSVAKDKQKGREIRRRRAKASVQWPWSEVTA
jgi:DNA damage-binding protein 1